MTLSLLASIFTLESLLSHTHPPPGGAPQKKALVPPMEKLSILELIFVLTPISTFVQIIALERR